MSIESLKSLVSSVTFDHENQTRIPPKIYPAVNRDFQFPQQQHFAYKPEFMTPQNIYLNSDKHKPNSKVEKFATLFAEREKKKFDFNFMKDK